MTPASLTGPTPLISGAQCRAARSLLGWTQSDVARQTGLSKTAIVEFEMGQTDSRGNTRQTIAAAFIRHGLEFMPPSGVNRRAAICHAYTDDASITQDWPAFLHLLAKSGHDRLDLYNWPEFAAEFAGHTGITPASTVHDDPPPDAAGDRAIFGDRAALVGSWLIVPILNSPYRIAFFQPLETQRMLLRAAKGF